MSKSLLARVVSGDVWHELRTLLGVGGARRSTAIADSVALQQFLSSRASHVAQSTLYGYLRTRGGVRYPELFASDAFIRSINIAKWNFWLACLADLAVFAGGLVASRTGASQTEVAGLMNAVVESVLGGAGIPPEAGPDYPQLADHARERVRACEWASVKDDATPFSESPAALVRFAPVIDELKALDSEVVRNSVRFAWQDVRRDLRRDLDAAAVLASASAAPATSAAGHS